MTKWMVALLFVFLISCKEKDKMPAGIIRPEKMQLVLWDYLNADAFSTEFISRDSTKEDTLVNLQMQNVIFKHHKITREAFYNSYRYYNDRPEIMTAIIDSMVARQQRKKTGAGTIYKMD